MRSVGHSYSKHDQTMNCVILLLVAGLAAFVSSDKEGSLSKRESSTTASPQDNTEFSPPVPAWPDQFSSRFHVYIKDYGSEWNSTGIIYYDWKVKTFRADYNKWCFPLSESGSYNHSCSFLATNGNMYYVNHTSHTWEEMSCCMFQKGLATVPPDWMGNCQYNGTKKIQDVVCDVWWYPGTNNPQQPCYSYWNVKDQKTPVQFFGISPAGPTMLGYFDFKPGKVPPDVNMKEPNKKCDTMCESSLAQPLLKMAKRHKNSLMGWPEWPSCE